ncbi:hypothetical protein [Endozoicomonas sp. ONNA2]|uniref:hypothetical protein n=1 Tax=Endozoicomonas sp. ONNA2 TaxID=2828741 RepID=UPI00214876EC|nr:hypothetical protein [Endozoicomonas sp. ONNA2]
MIFSSYHRYSQQTPLYATEESPGATASKDIKFGDIFRRIDQVFQPKTLEAANLVINSDSEYFVADPAKSSLNSRVCSLVQKGLGRQYAIGLFSDYLSWGEKKEEVIVAFDRNCKIINPDNLLQHLNTINEALIELTKEGLELLAGECSLGGRVVDVDHVYILRNYLTCGRSREDHWCRNMGQYTLKVQMNDDSSCYKGGGLQTAELEKEDPLTGKFPNKETVETNRFKENRGYVFSNRGDLIHKDETVTQVSNNDGNPVEQRLFMATVSDITIAPDVSDITIAPEVEWESSV